jgi:hypothetical protein
MYFVYYCYIIDDVTTLLLAELEHLEFALSTWTIAIVHCLLSWHFPSLHTLNLVGFSRAWSLSARLKFNVEAKNGIIDWIKNISTLRHARIRWFRLTVDECAELCAQLPALQSIEFESTVSNHHVTLLPFNPTVPSLTLHVPNALMRQ